MALWRLKRSLLPPQPIWWSPKGSATQRHSGQVNWSLFNGRDPKPVAKTRTKLSETFNQSWAWVERGWRITGSRAVDGSGEGTRGLPVGGRGDGSHCFGQGGRGGRGAAKQTFNQRSRAKRWIQKSSRGMKWGTAESLKQAFCQDQSDRGPPKIRNHEWYCWRGLGGKPEGLKQLLEERVVCEVQREFDLIYMGLKCRPDGAAEERETLANWIISVSRDV